jgi:hypothetical protein
MPVDRGSIDAQLREIGEGERWWEEREFRDLPYVLHPDERLRALVMGRVTSAGIGGWRSRKRWLVVVTDRRLVFLQQDRFARRQVEIAAGEITRIHQSSRFRTFQIRVDTSRGRWRVRIARADALRISGALAALLPQPLHPVFPPDLEPLAWIPGITTVASIPAFAGIVSKVSLLSPPDYASRGHLERLEAQIERLQGDVDRLQQHVDFLENLLQSRRETGILP